MYGACARATNIGIAATLRLNSTCRVRVAFSALGRFPGTRAGVAAAETQQIRK